MAVQWRHAAVFLTALFASLSPRVIGQCDVLSRGGYIERTLRIRESVCDVMRTAIIAKDHTLHLEPGAVLRFAPGVMLAINGTLMAKVNRQTDGFCPTTTFVVSA